MRESIESTAAVVEGEPPQARSERIREILDDLIRQRQSLRIGGNGVDPVLLEANRRSIVYWQTELAQALVTEHGKREAAA